MLFFFSLEEKVIRDVHNERLYCTSYIETGVLSSLYFLILGSQSPTDFTVAHIYIRVVVAILKNTNSGKHDKQYEKAV